MTGWAAWTALGLGILNVVTWTAVIMAGKRMWRQMKPIVEPYLAMFVHPEPVEMQRTSTPTLGDE